MNFALVLFGFSGIVVQTLLFRELWTVFQGNELTVGIMFSQWLLGIALGIILRNRIAATTTRAADNRMALSLILFAVCSAGGFAVVRSNPFLFPFLAGEGIAPSAMLWGSLIVLAPVSLWSGTLFKFPGTGAKSGSGYLLHALGALAGGVAVTFVFIPLTGIDAAPVLALIAGAHFLTAAFLFSAPFARYLSLAFTVLVFSAVPFISGLGYVFTGPLQGYQVLDAVDARFTRIVRAERNGEERLFYGGIPFLAFPAPRTASAEITAHVPLLLHEKPRNVLFVGGGELAIGPVLTHPVETLDYIGPDPAFSSFVRRYRLEGLTHGDPRFRIIETDAREFLTRSRKKYDVIVVGAPPPVNLLLNRFYTDEFFGLLKDRLSPGGIGIVSLPGSLVYIDRAMAELNDSVITALQRSFRFVRVIPGEKNLIVFSFRPSVSLKTVKQRLIARNVSAFFLSPRLISRLDDLENFRWFRAEMRKCLTENRVNRDLHPQGMLAALVYRQSVFAPRAAQVYRFAARHAGTFSFSILLFFVLFTRKRTSFTAVSTGFCAMSLFLLGLWGVQGASGSLYRTLGFLTACFLAGWGAGAGTVRLQKKRLSKPVFLTEILFLLLAGLGWIAATGMPAPGWFYYLFVFGAGLAAGMQFPLIIEHTDMHAGALAKISLTSILGGWIAAGLGGAVLIPAMGVRDAFFFIAVFKLIGVLRWIH